MRECLGRAPEPHLRAEVVLASLTKLARLARKSDFQGDSVARLESRDAGADGLDDSGRLMAEGHWLSDEDVAIAVVLVVVQVRAANAGGLD
jgi:hypothetical protein